MTEGADMTEHAGALAEVIRTTPLRGLRLTERYVGAMTRHILGSSWLAARDAAVAERYERDLAAQNALIATAGLMETQRISPECRDNRTVDGAWNEAVRRLREIYDAQVAHDPTITLALSIGRLSVSDPGQDKEVRRG